MSRIETLHIYLFGDFRLSDNHGTTIMVAQARHQALLTYLLLHRHAPQARRHLAFLLWPDSSETQALTNLRKALTHLRQMSPSLDQAIYADYLVVQWRPSVPFTLDIAEFEAKLNQATAAEQSGHTQEALTHWSSAVALYSGPLTPSCYDEWIIAERERIHQLALGALERLVAGHEGQKSFAAAIIYAQHLLRLDPLQESMYLQLMRLQALQGDRAGALRTYHTCASLLARELGVDPAAETQVAYARLLKLEEGIKAPVHSHAAIHLVGRRTEWEALQQQWQWVMSQGAQFICIWGEAGIGKSQLAEEMLKWVSQQGITAVRTRAYAGEGQLAYAPIVEWLRSDALRAVRPRLAAVWLSEAARLMPEILSEQASIPAPEPMNESWQRQRLWEALARALLAAPQPIFLLIDDLQWCDAETLEWLRYLLHFAPQAHLFVLGTARPEEIADDHPLQALCRHLRSAEQWSELELGPLDATESASLAAQIAKQPLDKQTQQLLYRATAGNPLFIVEMTRAGLGEQTRKLSLPSVQEGSSQPILSLPPKMQAVIQSRLAQLSSEAHKLAQLAAVISQDFTFELLLQASNQDEDSVVRGLDELWQRRIVRRHGAVTYDFSHDRIRDVAYGEMSPVRQRQLHFRVAQALKTLYAETHDSIASQLAVHYDKGGAISLAVTYYQIAATVAQRVFAYTETIAHLNRLLYLHDLLPDTPESNEQKLDALLLLGQVLVMVKGYTAAEVETTYNQARIVCESINDVEKHITVLCGLRNYWGQRCEWQTVIALETTILQLAQRTQKVTHLQIAFQCLGDTLIHQGNFKTAHEHFLHVASLSHPKPYLIDQLDSSFGPGLNTLCRLAEVLWFLGYPEQAQTKMDQALTLARNSGQPFDMLFALDFLIEFAHNKRQQEATPILIEEYRTLVAKHPFPYHVAEEMMHRGWLLAQTEEVEAGINLLKQGLDAWDKQEILLYLSYYRSWLAEVYAWTSQCEQGLSVIAETLSLVEHVGEQIWLAEIHRLKGELLLAQGSAIEEVESCFQMACQIAQKQQAKSLELRAATSLARLWQRQGRIAEAHQRLAEIYNWFTEGFDTADLQAASALLTKLESALILLVPFFPQFLSTHSYS